MALIPISETQLVFGYFHSYMSLYNPKNFLLPSLRQEGGKVKFPFPGADLIIDKNWLIQFKRPDILKTQNIKEFWSYGKPLNFDKPYFRFHIKNDSPTRQFYSLINMTKKGFKSTYISPSFTTEAEFMSLLGNHNKHLTSYAHIDLSQFASMMYGIGTNNDHTILYTEKSLDSGYCYCFSEPKYFTARRYQLQDEAISSNFGDLVESLRAEFFEKETLLKNDFDVFEMQRRLLVEHNIHWIFQYRRKPRPTMGWRGNV